MQKIILRLALGLFILSSCGNTSPIINAVCEENEMGNHILKWEIAPHLSGTVKVYASKNPKNISENHPIHTADIENGWATIINNNPSQRLYYKLVFNDKYRLTIASRNINIPYVHNFRDMGGYRSNYKNKTIKWGMIYRSAGIDTLDFFGSRKLQNLGIKTIIDFRTDKEIIREQSIKEAYHIIQIPVEVKNKGLLNDIKGGIIHGDILLQTIKEINRELVAYNKEEIHKMFEALLDERNYPLVIQCTSGNGRSSIASALIMAALGINEDIIFEDYRMSNIYLNIPQAYKYAYQLPPEVQEAVTTIYTAKEDFLYAARDEIKKQYGNFYNYLKEGIKLSSNDIKELRRILLE